MDREILEQYGIDYNAGLRRCTNDPAFYKLLLSMFLQDDCFPRAKAAYASGNDRALFSCLHELKGVSGNAGLSQLYDAVLPLVELLRTGNAPDRATIDRLFAASETAYVRACEGISFALAAGDA